MGAWKVDSWGPLPWLSSGRDHRQVFKITALPLKGQYHEIFKLRFFLLTNQKDLPVGPRFTPSNILKNICVFTEIFAKIVASCWYYPIMLTFFYWKWTFQMPKQQFFPKLKTFRVWSPWIWRFFLFPHWESPWFDKKCRGYQRSYHFYHFFIIIKKTPHLESTHLYIHWPFNKKIYYDTVSIAIEKSICKMNI